MTISTVKPCKKHGVVERYKNGACKICHYEDARKRLEIKGNKEKSRESDKKTRQKYKKEYYNKKRTYLKENKHLTEYVKKLICGKSISKKLSISYSDITKDIVDIKRLQLELNRAIKQREQQQAA